MYPVASTHTRVFSWFNETTFFHPSAYQEPKQHSPKLYSAEHNAPKTSSSMIYDRQFLKIDSARVIDRNQTIHRPLGFYNFFSDLQKLCSIFHSICQTKIRQIIVLSFFRISRHTTASSRGVLNSTINRACLLSSCPFEVQFSLSIIRNEELLCRMKAKI